MRTRRLGAAGLLAAAWLASMGGACATNPTPPGRLVSEEDAIRSGFGAYASIRLTTGDRPSGELIAVSTDRLWLLTDGGVLETLSRDRVTRMTLGVHDNNAAGLAAWVTLGALSTVSHGAYLLLTLPLWLMSGIPSAVIESHRGIVECGGDGRGDTSLSDCLDDLGAFARFPQGLPPGVGAAELLGRPMPRKTAPPSAPPAAPPGEAPAPWPPEPPPIRYPPAPPLSPSAEPPADAPEPAAR